MSNGDIAVVYSAPPLGSASSTSGAVGFAAGGVLSSGPTAVASIVGGCE